MRSSLLPLPHDYVVPGGRFSELYYWDSYFTMLGLHGSNNRENHRLLRPTAEHAKGGEYPLQDGFGWTNAVVARLLREHPEDRANRCRAGQGC